LNTCFGRGALVILTDASRFGQLKLDGRTDVGNTKGKSNLKVFFLVKLNKRKNVWNFFQINLKRRSTLNEKSRNLRVFASVKIFADALANDTETVNDFGQRNFISLIV
jgi:hypothetical protein